MSEQENYVQVTSQPNVPLPTPPYGTNSQPTEDPNIITHNGERYMRVNPLLRDDDIETINEARSLVEIASIAGITLKQAAWFRYKRSLASEESFPD